jgi:hypothetical protein
MHEDVLEEIQRCVTEGFLNRAAVCEWICDSMPDELGMDADLEEVERSLHAAIEFAFASAEQARQEWPTPTDCDRLAQVFEKLIQHGILAIENCGFTVQEGHDLAANSVAHLGYCFFHSQDVTTAAAGDGLRIAFDTVSDLQPNTSLPRTLTEQPIHCSNCGGRGWIEREGVGYAEACPSHSVSTVIATPIQSDPQQRIGQQICAALKEAGFTPDWNGSAETRIAISNFRWQRRLVRSSASDVAQFIKQWELDVKSGAEEPNGLQIQPEAFFAKFADFGPVLQASFHDECKKIVVREEALERQWQNITDNDRLSQAFEALRQQGIFAAEHLGPTLQDAWAYAGMQSHPEHRGVVFFHAQDFIDATNGRGLYLAFGAIHEHNKVSDDAANLDVAGRVIETLVSNGLTVRWSGSTAERLLIEPFEWKKRRWTEAPHNENRVVGAYVKIGESPAQTPLTQHPLLVRACSHEPGIHIERMRWMKEKGAAVNSLHQWQVGSLGSPMVFVLTGEITSFMPQPAINNHAARLDEYFERGTRSRS